MGLGGQAKSGKVTYKGLGGRDRDRDRDRDRERDGMVIHNSIMGG